MTMFYQIIVVAYFSTVTTAAISVAVSAACCHALQDPRSLGPFALFIFPLRYRALTEMPWEG
jgi:hypothetical protein